MRIKQIILILLLLGIIGCKGKAGYILNGDTLLFKEYYKNGNIKMVATYDLDTILDGQTKLYFENGKLARKVNYENGKLSGLDSIFYESGNLRHVQQWLDSTLIRDSYSYYDSLTSYVATLEKDTFIIKSSIIESYSFLNSKGDPALMIEYPINKTEKIYGDGWTIISVYLDTLTHYDFTFILATPPFFQNRFYVQEEDVDKKLFSDTRGLPIDKGRVGYHFTPAFGDEDKYKITAIYNLLGPSIDLSDTVILNYESGKFSMSRPHKDGNTSLLLASE